MTQTSVGAAPEAPPSRPSPLVLLSPILGVILVIVGLGLLAYYAYPVKGTEIAGGLAGGALGLGL
ncbi:MAG TPA: hypothetical protein VKG44_11575, partial [Candidatus Baltobacteraceae bacterium]|nr:hypothetical protein [Candidatus Baltobacteraceae bacterium]